jgi:aryl-alcohol dehydrogenase-like predicted oxidoreductase
VTFIDTADVYGDGRSKRPIGRFLCEQGANADNLTVATKMGRRVEQIPANYTTRSVVRRRASLLISGD